MSAAFTELRVLAARKAACLATVAEIEARGETAENEADRFAVEADKIKSEIAEREAEAAYAGYEAPGARRLDRRHGDLLRKVVAHRGAADIARRKAEEARCSLPDIETRIADAAILASAEIQREALAEISADIPKLALPLARLIAADFLRHRLAGNRFSYDPSRHGDLINGAWIAGEAMRALARWSPSDWPAAVDQAALRLAEDWTAEIEGDDNEDD
ncbi:hypothetical protein [Devosia elaeis]|uniref:hypothetical protein n=1 Tax=Devosia elaeis TaxID=1770058 RepID=UPI000AABD9FE|nr:hypothetical protein [Devosia elaeis]